MYQSFAAIVKKGNIKPLEKVKLKESARVLVTVVDEDDTSAADWNRLKKWITRQRRKGKLTSYSTLEPAKQHLRRLMK